MLLLNEMESFGLSSSGSTGTMSKEVLKGHGVSRWEGLIGRLVHGVREVNGAGRVILCLPIVSAYIRRSSQVRIRLSGLKPATASLEISPLLF